MYIIFSARSAVKSIMKSKLIGILTIAFVLLIMILAIWLAAYKLNPK
jgi:phosphate starvation-inducible membrane PsiE